MFKKITILLLVLSSQINAQVNLVMNPSFESYTLCPVGPDELYKATGWQSFFGSPDYYNSCGTMGTPMNWGGFQQPSSGNAYSGLGTYYSSIPNYREFVAGTLSTPLTIGMKYFVSFRVSLSLGSSLDANCSSNRIGVKLTKNPLLTQLLINNTAKVNSTTFINDSLGWTHIKGSFVADSLYNHIVIGNFYDDSNTGIQTFYNTFVNAAYYFLDDVCLSTDSLYASNYTYVGLVEQKDNTFITIYPNPVTDKVNIRCSFFPKSARLLDIFGRPLNSLISVRNSEISIDLETYPIGIYLLELESQNTKIIYKLIKQ